MGQQPTENNTAQGLWGLYRFIDKKQPEVKWTAVMSLLMECLFVALSLHSNFTIYESDICNIGKAGRYPIEYHNTPHIFLSPNSLFVTAPRLDIRCISAPPSENCSGRVRWNGSSARSRCLRWPWPAPDTGLPSCRPRKRSP